MPTLNIGGNRVKVDDSFMSMPPEQQNATVEEIASKIGVQSDAALGEPDYSSMGFGEKLTHTWPAKIVKSIFGMAEDAVKPIGDVVTGNRVDVRTSDSMNDAGDVYKDGEYQGNVVLQDQTDIQGAANAAMLFSPGSAGAASRMSAPARQPTVQKIRPLTDGGKIVEAGKRIGVDVPKAVATDNIALQSVSRKAAEVPFLGSPIRKSAQHTVSQLDDTLRGVQEAYGQGNISSAGADFRNAVTNTAKELLPSKVSAKYDLVDDLVDASIKVPLAKTRETSKNIIQKLAESGLKGSKAVEFVETAIKRDGLTYNGVKGLRTRIGEMLNQPNLLPANTSQAELKQIYAALSDDLANVVKASGNDATKAFATANKYASRVAGKQDALNKIINVQKDEALVYKIRDLASNGRSASLSQLMKARSAVKPEVWDDVAASVLKDMGRATKTGDFSPARFLTEWGKLSKGGKNVLFGSTGKRDLIKHLDDIATVSKRFDELNQFANPSGTGGMVTTAMAAPFALLEPTTFIVSIVGGGALARVMSSPANAKYVSQYSAAKLAYAMRPTRATLAILRNRSAILATILIKDGGAKISPAKLADELSGGAKNSIASDKKENMPDVEGIE